jgi:hypothetical protein
VVVVSLRQRLAALENRGDSSSIEREGKSRKGRADQTLETSSLHSHLGYLMSHQASR